MCRSISQRRRTLPGRAQRVRCLGLEWSSPGATKAMKSGGAGVSTGEQGRVSTARRSAVEVADPRRNKSAVRHPGGVSVECPTRREEGEEITEKGGQHDGGSGGQGGAA
ncbi:hypothetical protein NDU88_005640 [Pleurodeles waltl]|uniref:Uncharacterized protein n=1 Tax=Pleurodeles waltl TaxID=8319 RepID=A0AAV7W8D8_PLEWA|nr:hypothetical protein NDU88_005640 [Pleurodeles waltl]